MPVRASVLILALLVALAIPAAAAGAAPVGPRLATVELIDTKASLREEKPPLVSVATVNPATGKQKRILTAKLGAKGPVVPTPFFGPAWSSNGGLIAFAGRRAGDGSRDQIFVAAPDGSRLRPLSGTEGGTSPVFSPDGHTLAFARIHSRFRPSFYSSTTAWVVDLRGGRPRRLTPWRHGLGNVPASFTRDGSGLLLTVEDDDGPRVVQVDIATGVESEVLPLAEEPVFSPDGSKIAFIGYLDPDLVEAEEDEKYLAGELYVARADGTEIKRLSRTEDVLESSPSWDPSGQRIGYVQFRADTSFAPGLGLLFPYGNALMQVNADGSCRKRALSRPKVALYGVAWQPGAGRGAGRLNC
jgi:Tol biopolymer transport system component